MKRVTAFAVLLVVLAAPAWAGWDEGVAAYNRGDYATAFREMKPLAEQGNASAQYNLGFMYGNGEGVTQDYAEAVRWYRRAAEQGHAGAQTSLGVMYHNGRGVTQDYAEAVRWHRKSAEQGNARAQFNLALMYDKGKGVPQDYAQAVRWYRKAAEQGHAGAQFNLALKYEDGRGVTQDYVQAVRWYRKAAEQGVAEAQHNLGFMYDKGRGVTQDYAEAMRWYRKAAEQGYASAQYNLALMYNNGEGVPQDYVRAHKWFNLAAARGDTKAAKNRDIVAKRMTPKQIAEAQRRARAWQPRAEPPDRATPAPNPALARQRIARIQRQLASLGYNPGPADGILGPKTRATIRAFQAREGLPVTGTISDGLETALRAAIGTVASASAVPRSIEKASTGSGFYVSSQGHVLTNKHVVNGCVVAANVARN